MARFHMTLPLRPGVVYPFDPTDGGSSTQLYPHIERTPLGTTLVFTHPVTGVPVLLVALTVDDTASLADDIGAACRADSQEALDAYLASTQENGESCTPWTDEEPFPEVHDPMCGYFGYGYCQECRPPEER